ncbi:MAG: helicase [Clostridiales bacterium 43-6]|nr:MAG: helicase [Clostridiales bacterium 43-6]
MVNKSETEEREYLAQILEKLKQSYREIDGKILNYAEEIQKEKQYIWENLTQFDAVEKAANRTEVQQKIIYGEKAKLQKRKITKLIDSPYFGRIDFTEQDEHENNVLYIGIHTFTEGENNEILITDWRAPVSALFYNFETGQASYTAPMGEIFGEIHVKRQYKIKNSVMEFMIESAININDEILQKELSQTSNEKMKNIVATIQREQNTIIRNESSRVLIIQGVAGSGKTSIALHRVAFLLYRYKGTLLSKDILIISPNQVFGDYISNVLPELGEEEIADIGFEEIAEREMGTKISAQTFEQQVSRLIDTTDEEAITRIRFKATVDFVKLADEFLTHADECFFTPSPLKINGVTFSQEELFASFRANRKLPVMHRFDRLTEIIIDKSNLDNGRTVKKTERNKIKNAIAGMFKFRTTMALYRHFYDHIGKSELYQPMDKNTLEYADVFPYVYFKLFLEGAEGDYRHIKHLLVDEMQDYTPMQYQVLTKLFRCKMTILGDGNQSVNPYSSTTLEAIKGIYPQADCVELCKSYRSTMEIMSFAQSIKRNDKLIPVERHGEEPLVKNCFSQQNQRNEIIQLIEGFLQSDYHSLAIICKTQPRAQELYEQLKETHPTISLLSFFSKEFKEGIVITTAHMAKGLEFDQVIVPDVNAYTYQTDIDKSMLYIACTRAMHKLAVLYYGERSGLMG